MKHPGKQRNAIRLVIEGLALSIVLLLALVAVMENSGSAPTAHASSDAGAQASAPARAPAPKAPDSTSAPEAQTGSLEIREAYSDGGYREWLEREASTPHY